MDLPEFVMTREEYLTEKERWRKEYKVLSKDIRALKLAIRFASKGGFTALSNVKRMQEELKTSISRLQSMRAHKSNRAAWMMDDLEFLKEDSRRSVAYLRSQGL